MSVVDIVLLVVVAIAAVQGLRLGAVLQVLFFGGLWAGLVVGALLASVTVRWVRSVDGRTLVSLVTLFGVAMVFAIAGYLLGGRLVKRLHRTKLGSVDSGLGVVIAVVASLLVVWLVGSLLVNTASVRLNAAIADSQIIRSLDNVLPPPPSVFSQVQGFLSAEGFPPVFAQLAPASAGPVLPAGDMQVQAAARSAGSSTVKIVGQGCGDIQEGSGFVAAPGVVVTNAHVIAGTSHPVVEDGAGSHPASVALFDPSYDLAVLRVAGLKDAPLPLDSSQVARGVKATVLGYPGGGPFAAVPAGVMAVFEAQGRDIYGQGLTLRNVYELQAVVRPGNSGGPLVDSGGQVIGVVFSRSTTDSDIGYALASPDVLARVQRAEGTSGTVGTGACISG